MGDLPSDADALLRSDLPRLLAELPADRTPLWGRMSPQQMVEHLEGAALLSLGTIRMPLATPPEGLPAALAFLRSDQPMPREVVLPGLAKLPALRHGSMSDAVAATAAAYARFLASDRIEDAAPTHPVFGPLDRDDWVRLHVKHVTHHLRQFGLMDQPA